MAATRTCFVLLRTGLAIAGGGPLIYTVASIWALLGGLILIGDAMRVRRQTQVLQTSPSNKNGG